MPRLLAMLLVLLGLAALLTPLAAGPSHKVLAAHEMRLSVYFPHERHEQVTCLTCHRMADPAIKLSVEPRFHEFCRSCHEEKSRAGLAHGPVRDCAGCHHPQS